MYKGVHSTTVTVIYTVQTFKGRNFCGQSKSKISQFYFRGSYLLSTLVQQMHCDCLKISRIHFFRITSYLRKQQKLYPFENLYTYGLFVVAQELSQQGTFLHHLVRHRTLSKKPWLEPTYLVPMNF